MIIMYIKWQDEWFVDQFRLWLELGPTMVITIKDKCFVLYILKVV